MSRRATQLSPHFLLSEFASGDGAPFPAPVVANLRRVAAMLEKLRALLDDVPVIVTRNGGYRSPAQNQQSGGVPRSFHLQGLAADVVTREHPAWAVQERALQMQAAGAVGGVGCYPGFTHLDLGPKRQWTGPATRLARGGAPKR